MKKNLFKYFLTRLTILSGSFLIYFLPKTSQAIISPVYGVLRAAAPSFFSVSEQLANAFLTGIETLGHFFVWFIGIFFNIANWYTSYALRLNHLILENNRLLDAGWTITRDVANLGFVIIIVVTGIATILRYTNYTYQKILPKLIAAAIIINFSLVIAGAFINFSHSLTEFFLEPVSEGSFGWGDELASSISGAFSPQKMILLKGMTTESQDQQEPKTAFIIALANLSFIITFMTIATITMFVLGIMLFIRYVYLTILLIISPMVWLFWAFPALSGQFSKWWKKFVQWVFFLPAVSFFFYLTLVSLQFLEENPIDLTGFVEDGALLSIINQGAQMAIVSALLLAGLIVAQSMSITGANLGIQWAKSAGKWAGRQPGRWASRRVEKFTTKADEKGVSRGQKMANTMLKIPVIGGWAGRNMAGYTDHKKQSIKARSDKLYEKYKNFSKDQLADQLNKTTAVSDPAKTSALSKLVAEKDNWHKVDNKVKPRTFNAVAASGSKDEFLSYRPSEAAQFDLKISDAVKKYVKDPTKLNDDQIENKEVVGSLTRNQVNTYIASASDSNISTIAKTIKSSLSGAMIELNKYKDLNDTQVIQNVVNLQSEKETLVTRREELRRKGEDDSHVTEKINNINNEFNGILDNLKDNRAILERFFDLGRNPHTEQFIPQPDKKNKSTSEKGDEEVSTDTSKSAFGEARESAEKRGEKY